MEKPSITEQTIAHEIKGTPFSIIEHIDGEKTECFIAVGNQFVSGDKFASVKDAQKYIAKKPYDLIFATCIYLAQRIVEQSKLEGKTC